MIKIGVPAMGAPQAATVTVTAQGDQAGAEALAAYVKKEG
jgi:hypothetical protein